MRIEVGAGRVIELVQGDLTREAVDAIVNAANGQLAPGGGVCGAIHRAGSPAIASVCAEWVRANGPVATGEAVATTAGDLTARWVIHAVGPVWEGGERGEADLLAGCYRQAIARAEELGLESIAFPSISTGIYGYPVEQAAPVAVAAVREALEGARTVRLVRFVLFDAATLAAYERVAQGAGA